MLSSDTKSKQKKHFSWQDLKPVMSFHEYLWICGPVRWTRGLYNNLGLRFICDAGGRNGRIDWKQLWPPRVWMFRNFLWNSGLARRSHVVYKVFLWLD
jgi:hypothetical protein